MAGSYLHVVGDDGALFDNKMIAGMLDTSGDVYETVEEMYGMIWYLANALAVQVASQIAPNASAQHALAQGYVSAAGQQYQQGLAVSPTQRYKGR